MSGEQVDDDAGDAHEQHEPKAHAQEGYAQEGYGADEQEGHGGDEQEEHAGDRGEDRTAAEWTSLAICSAVLVAVVALLVSELLGPSAAALPVARVAVVRREGPIAVVEVDVRNGGDETAADVQVGASLTIGEDVEVADVVVPFLGGGESEEVVFTFTGDPADGELEVGVTGFAVP